MIVAESRQTRRIVGQIGRGQELVESLTRICAERNVRSGEVRAMGSLENVEVAEFDQAAKAWKPPRRFAGSGFEVLSLTGNVSEQGGQRTLELRVTLMRDRDNGVEVIGGRIHRARCFAVEFVIDTWDDLILRRAMDPDTGLPLWKEAIELGSGSAVSVPAAVPVPAAIAVPVSPPAPPVALAPGARRPSAVGPTWAEVARASEEAETRAAEIAEQNPDVNDGMLDLSPGDVIEHPKFGRCVVERVEGDQEFAHVRLRNARLVRLSLEVLRLSRVSSEDGHSVYRASVG